MRPLKLTMTAFGPYKNTEIVDFTELQEHNLFVISGNTGAGKTTIFDGISFALYGTASGQDREETKMLRSDFADDDVHTAVELEFLLKGKHYRIRRQIGHIKKGNKTKTGDDIFLFEIQGEEEIPCVDRQMVSEVNEKVEELIGLTPDQFKQIVMLPQGEFRKLITSDTENKEAILRRLFKTENYQALNEVLKEKRDKAQIGYDKQLQLRNDYIHNIPSSLPLREDTLLAEVLEDEYPNTHQITVALEEEFNYYEEKIKKDEDSYQKAYELANEKRKTYHEAEHLNERFKELEQKEKQLVAYEKRKVEFKDKKAKLDAAERANALLFHEKQLEQSKADAKAAKQVYEEGKNKYEQAEKELKQALATYEVEEKKQTDREQTENKLKELKKFLPTVQGIEETKQAIAQMKRKGIATKQEMETISKSLGELQSQEEKYRKTISELDAKIDELSDVPIQIMELTGQAKSFQRYYKLKEELTQLEKKQITESTHYEKLRKEYELKEAAWLSNQAVVLARHLHHGEPCPVCGSLEHPAIARGTEEIVSRESLQESKEIFLNKEKGYQQLQIQLEIKKTQTNDVLKEIKEFTKDENLEEFYSKLVENGKKMRSREREYNEARTKRKKIKQEEEKILAEKRKLEPLFRKLQDEYYQFLQDFKTKQATMEERVRDIPEELRVLTELQSRIKAVTESKDSLNKAWENAKIQLEQKKEAYTKAESNRAHLEKQKNEIEVKVKEAKETFQKKLIEANFASESDYFNAKLEESEQQFLKQQIETFNQELSLLTRQIEDLKKTLENKQLQDLEALKKKLEALEKEYEEAFKKLNEAREYQKTAQTRKEQIVKADNELNEKEELVSAIRDVHDTLRGQNSKKISFERYLQMEYLEQIIHSANMRLQRLSNNQYYLTRSDRQESHGKQSGLALDVYDNHTGQTRDVKTLSGGEKFHAALSLALGMSDVIQSFQGNISIDTMFIDEGFGSLDEEALTKAIEALVELMESGRMIGVISHVKELKEIFPAILEVTKRKEGDSETHFLLK